MHALPKTQLFLVMTLKCEEPGADSLGYQRTAVVSTAYAAA